MKSIAIPQLSHEALAQQRGAAGFGTAHHAE
jgi:hypothetical protein